ncbi:pyridoxamine 5'-phosphate oxidase family protein [Saccharopolyspora shandongensis]|uniref:pyridoxamine 5'-phosphate oxidase family protein n=1 Tax=Saccharopolyspora shandongensis TaxID=418495 RepID=UPI0033DFE9D8
MAVDVYHEGERAAQRRAGLLDQGTFSSRAVHAELPHVAREFLAQQVMLVLGAADASGRMWASMLTGKPGFLRAEDDTTLIVAAKPVEGDPLSARLAVPTLGDQRVQVGMIAIEPATRRRMRMNGRAARTERGLHIALDQVYANCPKYIQKREPWWEPAAIAPPMLSHELSRRQQQLIAEADTFFIATADRAGHADASHRGGNPGFVQVVSPGVLRWPDYIGNAMFNTLGNLEVNPAAGLLFPDWRTGTTVQVTGTARTDWDPARAASVPGAQRMIEFAVTGVTEIPGATGLRWSAPTPSRFNPLATPSP